MLVPSSVSGEDHRSNGRMNTTSGTNHPLTPNIKIQNNNITHSVTAITQKENNNTHLLHTGSVVGTVNLGSTNRDGGEIIVNYDSHANNIDRNSNNSNISNIPNGSNLNNNGEESVPWDRALFSKRKLSSL